MSQDLPTEVLGEASPGSSDDLHTLAPGQPFGPYTIEQAIGRGGMGEVYRARQQTPVNRVVALKLLQQRLRGTLAETLFQVESQALARLRHPFIAQVYDAGSLEGQPYLAMEWVEGLPMSEWISRRRPNRRQRLALVAEVAVVEAAGTATGVLMPYDAEEVKGAMDAYQRAVAAVLEESDWQNAGRGQRFIKKSGWRKIAKAFGLSVSRVESGVERDPEGNPVRAFAVYRATAPNGQSQDGDGYCSVDEDRFKDASGRKKLENDMRATATTRAKNRAISDLVGMGEVSAEEVDSGAAGGGDPRLAPFDQDLMPAWREIERQAGTEATANLSNWIVKDNGGAIPRNVGRALLATMRLLANQSSTAGEDTTPPPTDEQGNPVPEPGPDQQPPPDAEPLPGGVDGQPGAPDGSDHPL